MLIIIEGCDGAGKTTMAEELADRLDAFLVHFGPPQEGEDLINSYELLDYYTPQITPKALIIDRSFPSELIYGPIYRDESPLAAESPSRNHPWFHISSWLEKLGALKIVLSPRVETIKARVKERGDDFINQSDLDKIHASYEGFALTDPSWMVIHPEEWAERLHMDLVETIIAAAGNTFYTTQGEATRSKAFSYVGPKHARELILTDERYDSPALDPRNPESLSLLRLLDPREFRGAMSITTFDLEFWQLIGRPKILTADKGIARFLKGKGYITHDIG